MDLPFLPQPPAPLKPTGGKHLMFALLGSDLRNLPELLCQDQFFSFEISNNIERAGLVMAWKGTAM
jgi:hypothetical protein